MAQSSVAREPSMEEILASIRRIIESNDPVVASAEPVAPARAEPDFTDLDEISTDFEEPAHPVIADSMGMPLRAANSALPPRLEREPVAVSQDKPQSLADIAARVRNASERVVPPAPLQEEPVLEWPSIPAPLQQPVVESEPEPSFTVPQTPVVTDMPLRTSASLQGFSPAVAALADAAPVLQAEPLQRRDEPASAVMAIPTAEPAPAPASLSVAVEEAGLSLLSNEAGALVARSFGELAEAVDGAQRRSLDEMAEELLRPMLREWLDDNLPTLVERLVREEIERVARGPRR